MEKTRAVVIADAGPIIHLDELNSLNLLADFGKATLRRALSNHERLNRPPFDKLRANG